MTTIPLDSHSPNKLDISKRDHGSNVSVSHAIWVGDGQHSSNKCSAFAIWSLNLQSSSRLASLPLRWVPARTSSLSQAARSSVRTRNSKGTSLSDQVRLLLLELSSLQTAQAHPSSTSSGTVVHPKATIFAVAGPIVIGSNCIIEEGAVIVNR